MTNTLPGIAEPPADNIVEPLPPPTSSEPSFGQLSWIVPDAFYLLLICLTAMVAIAPFWRPGVSSPNDMLMGIYRVFELARGLDYGIPYSRLGLDLNFTYGAPLFQFYPPLVSYGALLFHWLGFGWIESAKAMFSVSLLLAGLGTYGYARWLFGNRRAALVSGLAYLLAPYILTVIYERGAAAESLALGLIPWIFWTLHRLLEDKGRRWMWISAILVSLLMLAHNITTLFVLPAAAVYFVVLAWRECRLRQLTWVGAAVALGLGLSAFYWLPALAEVRFTQVESSMLGGHFSALANLIPLNKLVQSSIVVEYWGEERFRLALWQAVASGLAILAVTVQSSRLRWPVALLASLLLVTLLLQTAVSRLFWEYVRLAQFIQFPWRLLGLASFCVAMLLGSLFLWRRLTGWPGNILAVVLLVFLFVVGTIRLRPELSPIWYQINSSQIGLADLFERGYARFSLFSDYQPDAQEIASHELAQPRPAGTSVSEPLAAAPQIQLTAIGPLDLTLQVQSNAPFPLSIHRIFFPGWQATIDGQRAPIKATAPVGLVTVDVPAGSHQVHFRFGDTPLRRAATAISCLSWIILVVGAIKAGRKNAVVVAVVAILFLAPVAVALARDARGDSVRRLEPLAVNFQDEIKLVGYDLPQTEWHPGDVIPLKLVWFAQDTPASDYRVFVHLALLDDTGKVAQTDALPVLGYSPPTRWEPGELVIDEQHLQLGVDVPPGTYQLLLGLYAADPPSNLRVLQAPSVLPGDRIPLSRIQVTPE